MKELSDITAGFIDHGGLYQPLARRLAQAYKRIIYHDPLEEAFETVNSAMIGESFPPDEKFRRTDDIWLDKEEIDIWVFPDSRGAGMQLELQGQGYPVWGSRKSIFLENSRELFIEVLERLGLDVPPHQIVKGIDNLRVYLKDKENQIIKISRFRGTMETRKWVSMDDDEAWLDWMAVKLGGLKNELEFIVFESIDTPFEIGGDTYFAGEFPSHLMDGYEWKDKGYFGAFKPVSEMPEQTQAVMEAFTPILGKAGHINFWSMEIRVKDDRFYFIDPTPRGPVPGTGSQMAMYTNLPEIIAAGAHGDLVEPVPAGKFTAECALSCKTETPVWPSARIPEALKPWVNLSGCVNVRGRYWFPPSKDDEGDGIGWMSAIGDTPSETITKLLDQAKELPEGVTANTESLIDLLKEIHKAEEEGIPFTPQTVPEPEEVIQHDE